MGSRRLGFVATMVIALTASACTTQPSATSRSSGTTSTTAAPTTSTSAPTTFSVQVRVLPGHLPAPVYRTVAAAVGGRLYVLGGIDAAGATIPDVERVDPATGAAAAAGALALPTHGAAALTVAGRILVFGGATSTVHQTVQSYDPETAATTVAGQLPGPRADLAAAAAGGDVVLLGGFDGTGALSSVLASPNGVAFHEVGTLSLAVRYPAVAAIGGTVYLFGGLLSGGEYTGVFTTGVQAVDVATGSARVVADLPVALAHAKAAVIDGQVLVMGGSTPAGPSNAIYRFDPATARLTRIGMLPEPLTDGAVAVLGTTAYWVGGIAQVPVTTEIAVRLVAGPP